MSAAKPDRRALSGAARIYAVQALFQMEAADQSATLVAREFQDWRIGVDYEEVLADAQLLQLQPVLGGILRCEVLAIKGRRMDVGVAEIDEGITRFLDREVHRGGRAEGLVGGGQIERDIIVLGL